MNDNLATDVIIDETGNHNGAVKDVTGTATSTFHSVAGKINKAQDFDGTDDYIEVADHADFTPALIPFSISAWVYMHDASDFVVTSKGVLGVDGEWVFYIAGDDILRWRQFDESLGIRRGRKYNSVLTGYENQWIHLVATADGGALSSGLRIYLNAIRIDDTDDLTGIFVSVENLTHAIWIGRYDTSYANGLIDNVVFFSKEVTPDEVKRIYNNGHGTEILAEVDSVISPRRSNTSPLGLRARYEFP